MIPKKIPIKVMATEREIEEIEKAIERGYGRSRGDLCRIAMIKYLDSINEEKK